MISTDASKTARWSAIRISPLTCYTSSVAYSKQNTPSAASVLSMTSMLTMKPPWKPTTPPVIITDLSQERRSFPNTPGGRPSMSTHFKTHGFKANKSIQRPQANMWTAAKILLIKSTKTICVIVYSRKEAFCGEAFGSRKTTSISTSYHPLCFLITSYAWLISWNFFSAA